MLPSPAPIQQPMLGQNGYASPIWVKWFDLVRTYMHRAPSYTVAQLPSNASAGDIAFVSDASGGAVLAFNDGTNWRKCTDRVIVS